MSVYNGEKYLTQAIESILSQTYTDFEFIIINDGSTDKSLEILNKFKKENARIRIISRENKGLIYSLNEGVRNARGEYIARMDADDISLSQRFEKQFKYMKENDLAVCGTWAEGIDNLGNKIKEMDYPPSANKIKIFTLLHNPFIHPSVMFRKDVFEKVGGYRKIYNLAEDHELWTRMIFTYKADNVPEKLLKYRLHDGQITRRNNFAMRMKGILVRILALFRFIFN
ncbi:MAG: WbfO protein [Parcubacteria group bacterium GW2011_GWA1_44_13]|uniref:WbfO protein n=1 Tax=Candidatus Nomurabacteria bacterium GW2011_GWB1_44_12 TaxID=1618748 RepID=A0A837ICB0_9BACT|nr:MAG: WbfO protein [Candidatus Nomurabacteria bacterium GW2011_GWB1_44_12]KKT38379.1 MAG: WbfO protein [Parcubacteria group bacterium GW2011_GWA1_44_13]